MMDTLNATGRFSIDRSTVTKSEIQKFNPNFADYDVVLSNYNGERWKKETEEAFIKYIKEGGNLVVVHAANNSFPDWKEFNEMIGLGGWGGRNEKDGPYVYWKDGKIVRDNSKGRGGSHGSQPVNVRSFCLWVATQVTHPVVQVVNRNKENIGTIIGSN